MKHILNDLSEQEKNSIREQHTGGIKVMTENFSKLINSKLGDVKPIVNEQMGENALQLAKDVVNFIWDMDIVPGPLDAAKLLYDLYNSKNPVQTIKDFIYGKIPQPQQNWKKIEQSLDRLGGDVSKFKSAIYQELKSKL